MAPFSKILSSRPSWLRVSIRGRPGENPTWRESAPRRRHSFRQRITELAAQWTRRATSFKDRSSSNSFSARLRRSESSSAEPFGRIWTSCHPEVHYCIILCEINRHINAAVKKCLNQSSPVISVDTKKKELVGNYDNAGRQWLAANQPTNFGTKFRFTTFHPAPANGTRSNTGYFLLSPQIGAGNHCETTKRSSSSSPRPPRRKD